MMPEVIFLLMNSIVIISSFIITRKLLRISNSADFLISWFILYFAQIVFSELILGIIGILYLRNIILLNIIILLVVFLNADSQKSFISIRPFGLRYPHRENNQWIKSSVFQLFNNKSILFVISLILSLVLVKAFTNLINPSFGWDSLNYHFSFPVEWMKTGTLNNPIVVSDDPFPSYYPINGSLFFLWFILPFKSAFLADLSQLPFFIVSFLAIFSIARKIGLNQGYSFLSAALFVTIPNFVKQLQIGYVDIMVAGCFLAALNFIFLLKENFNLRNTIIFALSFGLLIGIKSTAIAYSIFLFIPFLFLVFKQNQNNITTKLKYIILVFLLISVFGSFSYLRNFLLTGNPLYPIDLTILGKKIFSGVIDRQTFTARNLKEGYSFLKLLLHEGLGVQSLLIIFPGTLFAFFVGLSKKNNDLFLRYFLLLPLLLYLTYQFILPLPNSRYLYPMLGTGILAGMYLINYFKIPFKTIKFISVLFIFGSAIESAYRRERGTVFLLSLILFIFFIACLKSKTLRTILFSKITLFLFIFFSIIILQPIFIDYKNNEYLRYIKRSPYWPEATKAWSWLNEHTNNNNISYVGKPVPFPLYGRDFKNNVYYTSVNAIDPVHLHNFKDSKYRWDNNAENMHKSFEEPANYRGNADYQTWLNNLKKRKTDFLFIYSLHHTKLVQFPLEEQWAQNHPESFSLVFDNAGIKIYRLKK